MKAKLVLIPLFLTVSLFQTFAQERVNREKISFIQESSILSNATGWAYNTTLGEWVDYNNVICEDKDYKTKNISLQGSWMMSHCSQNFIKMQTNTITLNGIKYYVLVIQKWFGGYEYPTIKECWYTYKKTFGFIYTPEEYQKLMNIDNLVEVKTQHMVCMGSKYEKYNQKKFLDLIQTELTEEKNPYLKSEDIFPLMKSKEGTIRFCLPSSYSKYDFEKGYFETSLLDFEKILIRN